MPKASQPPSPPPGPARPDAPQPKAIILNSARECLLTFALLFGVVTIVRWVVGPSPVSDAIPQVHLQLVIIGAAVGLLLASLILSPPGKASGGHINPAISFAMWRFGVFPRASVVPYIVAQLVGSVLGVLAGRGVWGSVVANPPVTDDAIQPGIGWSAGELFVAEALVMAIIVVLVGFFLRRAKLATLVPWLVGFLIGATIALLGTSSGGCVNPARQFGPAVVSGQFDFLWVYLLAPMVGAALAVSFSNRMQNHRPLLTHRLCGPRRSRSWLHRRHGT